MRDARRARSCSRRRWTASLEDGPRHAYPWSKRIVPLLKCDKGLEAEFNGCQLMKEIPALEKTLARAKLLGIVGTKMRSRIMEANEEGIKRSQAAPNEKEYAGAAGTDPRTRDRCLLIERQGPRRGDFVERLARGIASVSLGELIMFKLTLPDIQTSICFLCRPS